MASGLKDSSFIHTVSATGADAGAAAGAVAGCAAGAGAAVAATAGWAPPDFAAATIAATSILPYL